MTTPLTIFIFLTMLKKRKATPKGRPILLDLPLKEDGQLRRFAREKGLTPTTAARLLILTSLASGQQGAA